MPLDPLDRFFTRLSTIRKQYDKAPSRASKSKYLKLVKTAIQEKKWTQATEMLSLSNQWDGDVNLTEPTIQQEIQKHLNLILSRCNRNPMSATYYEGEQGILTYFNRNYMLPRPLTNVNQLKLYDKRLRKYIDTNKINNTTIYFLLFLLTTPEL